MTDTKHVLIDQILVQHKLRRCTVCVYLGTLFVPNMLLILFQYFFRFLLFLAFLSRLSSLSSSVKSPSLIVILSSLSSLKSNGLNAPSFSISRRLAVLRWTWHSLVSKQRLYITKSIQSSIRYVLYDHSQTCFGRVIVFACIRCTSANM